MLRRKPVPLAQVKESNSENSPENTPENSLNGIRRVI